MKLPPLRSATSTLSTIQSSLEPVWLCGWTCIWSNFNFFFFFAKIECSLYFLDRFDVLISKIIFKKWKNIINMYFSMKNYLKSNHYHTAKHVLNLLTIIMITICECKFTPLNSLSVLSPLVWEGPPQ